MKKINQYHKIGKLIQALGLDGRIVMAHDLSNGTPLLSLSHIFIELMADSFIPYFPTQPPVSLDDSRIAWYLDETESLEQAKMLVGKDVFVEKSVFSKLYPADENWEDDILGYILKDQNSDNQGEILSITETAGQLLAEVKKGETEILIPLSEDLIVVIDDDKEEVVMNLPEGIWDL